MSKVLKCITFSLCLTLMACSSRRASEPPVASPPPPPGSSAAKESQSPNASTRSEVGDEIPQSFTGTVAPQEKRKPQQEPAVLKEVRTGKHEDFDRIVFEFSGKETPGFNVRYTDKPVTTCGAGEAVRLSADNVLLVQMMPAHAHDEQGNATVSDRDRTLDLPNLKQAKLICDFEADVQWALGVSKRKAYRVLELKDPSRLVVDIKHSRPSSN